MWDEGTGRSISLKDGSILFTMKFREKKERSNILIAMAGTTPAQVYDGSLTRLSFIAQQAKREQNVFDVSIYPNPFTRNMSVNIKVNLPESGWVKAEVISLEGKKVNVILAECHQGTNTLVWNGKGDDGSELASGIYIVRIEHDNINKVNKVVKN
jgi:flagellar hook assembly protein FlgD